MLLILCRLYEGLSSRPATFKDCRLSVGQAIFRKHSTRMAHSTWQRTRAEHKGSLCTGQLVNSPSSGAERQARTDSRAQRNNRAVLVSENGCSLRAGICGHRSARSKGRGREAGAAETGMETVRRAGGLSGTFTGFRRSQPLALKGEHPNQRDIGWKREILAGRESYWLEVLLSPGQCQR